MNEYKIVSIQPCAIKKFMRSWPCSGLHNIHHITACFHGSDLVDLDAFNDEAETQLTNGDDYEGTGAMPALLDDAVAHCVKIKVLPGMLEGGYRFTEKETV